MKSIRLAALFSHPIQYFAPLFKELDSREQIELTVFYCSKQGVEPETDTGFETEIAWDIPLLEGYDYKFLRNYSPTSRGSVVFDNVNPGILSALRKSEFDAIYINGYTSFTNWVAFFGAEILGIPIIFRGASTLDDPTNPSIKRIKSPVLTALFSRIDAFTAVGTKNKQYFLEYGVASEDIVLAPNAVDNEFFQRKKEALPEKNELRKRLGLDDCPLALFVGKLLPHKRPNLLIRAFERVRKCQNATLLFVGDGNMRARLEEIVDQRGLKEDVVFVGFQNQSELPKYYKAADVLVLPSSRETWGLVINEAMNFSLPVIASDSVGAVTDLVDNKNGRVVPSGDVDALAEALATVLGSQQLRSKMGEVSRGRIENWGIEETADGVVNAVQLVNSR